MQERKKESPEAEYVEVYVSKYIEGDDSANRKNILQVVSEDGTVKYAKSKYLHMYLAADNATYLIRNYMVDYKDKMAKVLGRIPKPEDGSGLIYFAKEGMENVVTEDYIKNAGNLKFVNAESSFFGAFDKVSIYRPAKVMRIRNSDDGWFKTSWYDYNLDGWATRYGMPLQLSLAMHLSTLAPDFAYSFSNIGAKETYVEIGLLETKNNVLKSKLLLDLGDGEKFYYIEEDIKCKAHKIQGENNEVGYSTPAEAEQHTDYSGEKGKKSAEKAPKKTAMDCINEIENDLKSKGYNQNNRAIAGRLSFVYNGTPDPTTIINTNPSIYDNNNLSKIYPGDIYTTPIINKVLDEDILKIQEILLDYEIAEIGLENNQPVFKTKGQYINSAELKKVQEILHNYYKLDSICNSVTANINYNDQGKGIGEVKLDNNGGNIYNVISSPNIENYQGQFQPGFGTSYHYVENGQAYDNNILTVLLGSSNGVIDGNQGDITYNAGVIYNELDNKPIFNSDIESFFQLNIIGDYANISNLPTMWQYVVSELFNYFPVRQYYRLIDAETGKPVTSLTQGKTWNDYEYLDSSDQSYYPDPNSSDSGENGWFWRNSIPKALKDAINNKVTDNKNKVNAQNVREVLDDMYEYNVGEDGDGFTRYVPVVLEVKDHWYQDLSFKGCYEWDTSEGAKTETYLYTAVDDSNTNIYGEKDKEGTQKASREDILYLEETSEGKVVQKKEPRKVGEAGAKVLSLTGTESNPHLYDKYDGNGKSEKKSKIDFLETGVDAIAMLEQIQGEDSQAIIRDYKALMKKYGITFKQTRATALKKELFSKVIEGYDDKSKILPEGDDSVIKANIPPTQQGFEKGLNVRAPITGTIAYRSDDAVCIEINAPNTDHDKYTILIEGFDVNENVKVPNAVSEGTVLGTTRRQDLKLTLRDENGAIVKNSYYENDYIVKTDEDEGRTYTEDEIRDAVYSNLVPSNSPLRTDAAIEALYNIQDTYHVDPIFAIAAAISESSAGTAWDLINPSTNNIFSIKGENGWRSYASVADAIEGQGGFADLIANSAYYFQAGKISIQDIGPTYCEGDEWANSTSQHMKDLLEAIGKE